MKALGTWLARHTAELRQALRTTLAGLIAFALAYLLHLPQGYWAVLTAVIIIQASVGGSLKAGIDRLVGTIAGAVWGVAIAIAIPHREVASLVLALALALGPLAVVSALKSGFRVAPVTAIIVLLSTTGMQEGPLYYAFERVLEIGLGCLVGLAVSLFILPARAHGLLARAAAAVLRDCGQLVLLLFGDLAVPADRKALVTIRGRIRRTMAKVDAFLEEARRERAHRLADTPDPEPVERNLRRLTHDLTAIGRALATPLPAEGRQYLEEPAVVLGRMIAAVFAGAADAYAGGLPPPALGPVDTALAAFDEAIGAMRQAAALRDHTGDVLAQVYGLSFALHQLRMNLGDLTDRIAERAAPQKASIGP